jgi:SH3-like domain-containing protein
MKSSSGSSIRQTYSLKRGTPIKIVAATKNLYRITLPDGDFGYVRSNQIEPIHKSVQQRTAATTYTIIDKPTRNAIHKSTIEAGDEFSILGKYEDYWFIKELQGELGWIKISTETSSQHIIGDFQE